MADGGPPRGPPAPPPVGALQRPFGSATPNPLMGGMGGAGGGAGGPLGGLAGLMNASKALGGLPAL